MNAIIEKALIECGEDWARSEGTDSNRAVYEFLSEVPISIIAKCLERKLNEMGHKIIAEPTSDARVVINFPKPKLRLIRGNAGPIKNPKLLKFRKTK